MKKLIVILFLAGSFNCTSTQATITATQMGMLDFTIDQNLSVNEMNGTIDVTDKLQTAVNNARNAYKSLYIPYGIYKISKTIDCILDESANPIKAVNIIGSAIKHPVIVITDNTTSVFNDTAMPNAVFEYHSSDPNHDTGWVMEGGIRGVDFDLGNGNPGAVAIYWGCAQHGYVQDININARDAFAGMTSLGGANSLVANVTVTGGKYGIYTHPNGDWNMGVSPGNTVVGCTFINQTNTPLYLFGWGGITLVGINIITDKTMAIYMDCDTWAAVNEFTLSMIDCKIEFTIPAASNVAISNPGHGTVSLRSIYVKGSGIVSDNGGDENLATEGSLSDWTCANYNYIDKKSRNDEAGRLYEGVHYDATAGTQFNNSISWKNIATPPDDLISKHIWATTPSFEDEDAVLVPLGSTTTQIQAAINANEKVCLAKGTYTLTAPIDLKANTILFGCPGYGACGSILKYGWTPTSQTWLISTADAADATTYLMDIVTESKTEDYLGGLHWRAGSNSIIRNVWLDKVFHWRETNRIRLYFSGNGGGRVYNYTDDKNFSDPVSTSSINHRKVKISGTSQSLTFYGLNLERGGAVSGESLYPMCEITNSSNVSIYGAKIEAYQPYASITNSSNVFMTNVMDLNSFIARVSNLIEIYGNSGNIELSNLMSLYPTATTQKLVKDAWNTNSPDRYKHVGLYYRNTSIINGINPAEIINNKWFVYPNPTKSEIIISSESAKDSNAKCLIYSLSGKVLSVTNLNSNETKVDLSNQSNGFYMVEVQDKSGKTETLKVVKTK
jgi:hypothetical protein